MNPSQYIPECFSAFPEEAQSALNFGIDLSLLEANLSLTHEERIIKHQNLLEEVRALKESGDQLRR